MQVRAFERYIPIIDFSLTVKAATLIFISGRGSAISSAKQGFGKELKSFLGCANLHAFLKKS